jgi:predicted DNA binding CopG/RHH family protein
MRKKPIPEFETEAQEQAFWAKEDSTDYVAWAEAEPVMAVRLRPTLKTISLRLPAALLAELKILAHKRDVPYQSLLKTFLAERIDQELRRTARLAT